MTGADEDRRHWSQVAGDWVAWARKPNHDAFWAYQAALVTFIGRGNGTALDVGCGEGRVSRVLSGCGYQVTAVDPVAEFVAAAAQAGSAQDYAVAAAAGLPFADARFDLVMAYNVLMDVADVPAAVWEMRRVMRPAGQLVISICHPFADRGRFDGDGADAPFVAEGSYFGRRRFDGVEQRDGLRMHFAGWSQPLEDYVAALEAAGLAVTSLSEPVPEPGHGRDHLARWSRMPLFLWLKARPLAVPA